MNGGYPAQAATLVGVAERMAALAERLDRGARLVTEGSDATGRVSVVIDRAGLAENIRIRADWRTTVTATALPPTIRTAYTAALGNRLTAALQSPADRADVSDEPQPSFGVAATVTAVPADQLARSFDRLSDDAWRHLDALQHRAAQAAAAPPSGTGSAAAGRVTVLVALDLRLECRIDDRWAGQQTGALLMNALNPALQSARSDLARVSDEDRFPLAGDEGSQLLDEFLTLLNDPHRFADELHGRVG